MKETKEKKRKKVIINAPCEMERGMRPLEAFQMGSFEAKTKLQWSIKSRVARRICGAQRKIIDHYDGQYRETHGL